MSAVSMPQAVRGMAMDEGMLGGAANSAVPVGRLPRKKATDAKVRAAGLMIVTPDGCALFLKRSSKGDHAGEWCFPGGVLEGNEDPIQAALRETREETGWVSPEGKVPEISDERDSDGVHFMTIEVASNNQFIPELNDEHVGWAWAPLGDPPQPLHPGVVATLEKLGQDAGAESGASRKLLRETIKYPPPKLGKARDDYRAIDYSFERGGAGKTLRESPKARHHNLTTWQPPEGRDLAPSQISSSELARFRELPARQQAEVVRLIEEIRRVKTRNPERAAQLQKQVDRLAGDAEWKESDHPRDKSGKFGSGGGTAKSEGKLGEAKVGSPGFAAQGLAAADNVKKQWAEESPIKTIDDLFVHAKKHQDALDQVGKSIQVDVDEGTQFKTPGVKGRPRVEEKVQQGKPPGRINDVVRGGFVVASAKQSDAVVEKLAKEFEVADEGWAKTPSGYFDRKVIVRFPSGQCGEVQLWHPDLLKKKSEVGHKLYEQERSLSIDDPRRADLARKMQSLYGSVKLDENWCPPMCNDERRLGEDAPEGLVRGSVDGDPFVWVPGEAWVYIEGQWTRVDDAEIGMEGRVLSRADFEERFTDLPSLPDGAFGQSQAKDAEFEESKHPRGPGGRFTAGAAAPEHIDFLNPGEMSEFTDEMSNVSDVVSNALSAFDDAKSELDDAVVEAQEIEGEEDDIIETHGSLSSEYEEWEQRNIAALEQLADRAMAMRHALASQVEAAAKALDAVDNVLGGYAKTFGLRNKKTAEDAAKASKEEAEYVDGPVEKEPCENCTMFLAPDGCTAVRGSISPTGHCKYWKERVQDGEEKDQEGQARQAALSDGAESNKLVRPEEKNTGSATRTEAAKTGFKYVDDVLNSKVTRHAIDGAVVNRKYKVPYTAGGSVPLEDPEMFVDGRFPREFELNGKRWNPDDPFIVHENIEQHVMEILVKAGMEKPLAYACAHWGWAEVAEGAWYAHYRINQAGAEQMYRPYMERIQADPGDEDEHPPNLYVDPYPHDDPSAAGGEKLDEPLPTDEEMKRSKEIVAEFLRSDDVEHPDDVEYDVAGDESLALDRASVREVDQDGRLRVEVTNISKANVCPYLGREIPGYEQMGLDPEKIYRLLRHPEDLAKSASSFNNQPLLSQHVPVFAADYAEQAKKFVVGSTGEQAEFVHPYLRNSLVVWDGEAIRLIQSGEQKEISCGYHYTPDMTPGIYESESYDGVMRDIVGNHVALVREGRAGPDVVVGDSKENVSMRQKMKLTRQGAIATCVLASYLRPRLAQDASVNLLPIFDGVTAKNFGERKGEILRRIDRACKGKIAVDTSLGEVAEFLDMLDAHGEGLEPDELPEELEKPTKEIGEKFAEPDVMDADPMHAVEAFLKDKLSPGDLQHVLGMLSGEAHDDAYAGGHASGEEQLKKLGAADDEETAETAQERRDNAREWRRKGGATDDEDGAGVIRTSESEREDSRGAPLGGGKRGGTTGDQPPHFKSSPRVGGKMAGDALTKADVEEITRAATAAARKTERDIREAERAVHPWVGNLAMTFDSAEEVYRKALKMMGVTGMDKVHKDALRPILEQQPLPGSRKSVQERSKVAADAASTSDFATRFPDAGRIRLT